MKGIKKGGACRKAQEELTGSFDGTRGGKQIER